MKINRIYFSPTGSTKKVVRLIAQAWVGESYDIDCSVPDCDYGTYSFAKEELCIIGVPSFGGRVPEIALSYLQRMKAVGTPTVIVTTFGNRDYDDTLLELRDTIRQNGFHVVAAIAAVTEHSIMHQFGTGRPDVNDEKELHEYAKTIKLALERSLELQEPIVKGNTPYRSYSGLPMKPAANKTCTKCGVCAKVCPMQAIPSENPSETDKDRCITCMRCVAICPQHARKLNPALLFAAGQKMKKGCSTPKRNEFHIGDEHDKSSIY